MKISWSEIRRICLELQMMGFEKKAVTELIFCESYFLKMVNPENLKDLQSIFEDTGITDKNCTNEFCELISNYPRLAMCQTRQLKDKILILFGYGFTPQQVKQILHQGTYGFSVSIKTLQKRLDQVFGDSTSESAIAEVMADPKCITSQKKTTQKIRDLSIISQG
eukprot:TRINITY_DN9072_c1_g1_i1.p1 TRINITY_DN9072_c1_g1~~TRINITY_DN9072_c1_g1_i1.p1  ORF type:complete len:165 (-),score=12.01 TRINITY_DN9072_c1_g1_i1:288-782(-)